MLFQLLDQLQFKGLTFNTVTRQSTQQFRSHNISNCRAAKAPKAWMSGSWFGRHSWLSPSSSSVSAKFLSSSRSSRKRNPRSSTATSNRRVDISGGSAIQSLLNLIFSQPATAAPSTKCDKNNSQTNLKAWKLRTHLVLVLVHGWHLKGELRASDGCFVSNWMSKFYPL